MSGVCSIDGCETVHYARGWCRKHYVRWQKWGDPLFLHYVRGNDAQRMESHIRRDADGCWRWTGNLYPTGYGQTSITVDGRRVFMGAHRAVYEQLRGPIPAGLVLDHLCRNPRCVNPDHLEPVTHQENILRGVGTSARNAAKTHCDAGHPFTENNTRRRGDRNGRICILCGDARNAQWRQRQRVQAS